MRELTQQLEQQGSELMKQCEELTAHQTELDTLNKKQSKEIASLTKELKQMEKK